jgi:hypothetical protein
LAPLTALTSLDLQGCSGVVDEGVRELAPLTALTSINLRGCAQVTNEGVKALRASRIVARVNLAFHTVIDSSISLLGMKALRRILMNRSIHYCVRSFV